MCQMIHLTLPAWFGVWNHSITFNRPCVRVNFLFHASRGIPKFDSIFSRISCLTLELTFLQLPSLQSFILWDVRQSRFDIVFRWSIFAVKNVTRKVSSKFLNHFSLFLSLSDALKFHFCRRNNKGNQISADDLCHTKLSDWLSPKSIESVHNGW